jgi:hypothetical protein
MRGWKLRDCRVKMNGCEKGNGVKIRIRRWIERATTPHYSAQYSYLGLDEAAGTAADSTNASNMQETRPPSPTIANTEWRLESFRG